MNEIRINEQIAFLRHRKGVTQEVLAKQLGVTNQTISKWESGQCYPDIQLLPEIADFFGVSVDELLGHTAQSGLDSLCLTLKKYFTGLPEADCFDHVYRLAAQLHEIAVTAGYRRQVPWQEKDYAKEPAARWGLSACDEGGRRQHRALRQYGAVYQRPGMEPAEEIRNPEHRAGTGDAV